MFRVNYIGSTILAMFITPVILIAQEVRSLYSLFTEKNAVVESALNGTWYSHDFGDSVTFRQAGDNFYYLSHTSQGELSEFEAVLTKIESRLVLDIFPRPLGNESELYQDHILRIHSFYNVLVHEDTLHLASFNYDWFYEMAVKKRLIGDHQWSEKMMLLTAATGNLREMVEKYHRHENFFTVPLIFHRLSSTATFIPKAGDHRSGPIERIDSEQTRNYEFASTFPDCRISIKKHGAEEWHDS